MRSTPHSLLRLFQTAPVGALRRRSQRVSSFLLKGFAEPLAALFCGHWKTWPSALGTTTLTGLLSQPIISVHIVDKNSTIWLHRCMDRLPPLNAVRAFEAA